VPARAIAREDHILAPERFRGPPRKHSCWREIYRPELKQRAYYRLRRRMAVNGHDKQRKPREE